ncbi:hypothetical protein OG21DRAFT_1447782 [Imleria badia]|nr:hypothetical protein OG21DRAFT_1447782 [Imleria badia]
MSARISITTSRDQQAKAASLLSQYLTEVLKCPHAYIGGFAWSLLGNTRSTEDIDVLIETTNVLQLREKLSGLNERFTSAGIKFYFVKEPVNDLKGDALVRASKDNVLIETLEAGSIGLPIVAEPRYLIEHDSGFPIYILDPPVLLLTKMKRWFYNYESTRPKTLSKNLSDKNDLDFLIFWLSDNDKKIDFGQYKGKGKPELLTFVRAYRNKYKDNAELMEALQSILCEEDWNALDVTESLSAATKFQP